MQTPKSKPGSLGVHQKTYSTTPQTTRVLKTTGSGSDPLSTSPNPASRTTKDRSSKITECQPQRNPVAEKKRPNRLAELESQLTQLQDDLKKAKDQVGSSESLKRQAQHEAEEAKKQLLAMTIKLEKSHQHVMELSATEESRVQELVKISQDRDREWEAELQAVQKQHSMDSAALGSAMNEIMRLKKQLGSLAIPEAADEKKEEVEIMQLKEELGFAKYEVDQLRSALDAAENRYREEYIQSTLEIRNAYEKIESTKSEYCLREAGWDTELKKAFAYIEELEAKLIENDTKLHYLSNENDGLNLKIEKTRVSDEYENITKENEILKLEIAKREIEKNKEAIDLAESAKASEQEAMLKLKHITEQAENNSRKAARSAEQLDAAQTANLEMEAELRRMKVQLDQWRKAAEAAASMLSTGNTNNGKFMDKPGFSSGNYYHSFGANVDSILSDDMVDDESFKSKNGNMLKKIGVLWKKGQK